MLRPRTFAALTFLLSLAAVTAEAQQTGSPRAGRALWLEQQTPGVWISPRRMWLPTPGTTPLSACGPRGGCVPIVSSETCTVPICPGSGTVVIIASDVAGVSEFPRDYEGYRREIEALRADPALASVHGYLSDHPDHARIQEAQRRNEEAIARERARHEESVRWVSSYRDHDRLELALSASLMLPGSGGLFFGGTASAAYVFLAGSNEADDDAGDDVFINVLIGDQLGAELRVSFGHSIEGAPTGEWMTFIGVAPSLANRFKTSVVRMPTILGSILPELGLALRGDTAPTWYAAWNVPVSILLTHDLAFDAAMRLAIIDDWIPEQTNEDGTTSDPVETLVSISVGLRFL